MIESKAMPRVRVSKTFGDLLADFGLQAGYFRSKCKEYGIGSSLVFPRRTRTQISVYVKHSWMDCQV